MVQAERWLGVTHPGRIHVFLFRSPQEKYALMGAEGTNLAKPWRSEVFISEQGWPNPVLGHELVHVVARDTGRVAADLGQGLGRGRPLADRRRRRGRSCSPGGLTRTSGSALLLVACCRAVRAVRRGLSRPAEAARYTVSGSLLRFVSERWGARAVRHAYAEGNVASAVGVTLEQLETEWHRYLRAQTITRSALALAQARFVGPSVFSAVCPHTLAALRDELRQEIGIGADAEALQTCHAILAADQNDLGTRAALVATLARSGDSEGAARELHWLESRAPKPFVAAARQAVADEAFRQGRIAEAQQLYQELLQEPLEDDQRRGLQVKCIACDSAGADPCERASIADEIWDMRLTTRTRGTGWSRCGELILGKRAA